MYKSKVIGKIVFFVLFMITAINLSYMDVGSSVLYDCLFCVLLSYGWKDMAVTLHKKSFNLELTVFFFVET